MTAYGRPHRRRRAALLAQAIGTPCPGTHVLGEPYRSPNCTGLMFDPARMHLDHTVPVVAGGTIGDRIICAPCNTGAGATMRNQLHAPTPPQPPRHTRVW